MRCTHRPAPRHPLTPPQYTPLILLSGHPDLFPAHPIALPMLVGVWSITLVGIFVKIVIRAVPKWITAIIFIVQGWLALFLIPIVLDANSPFEFQVLFFGGITYTVGAMVYVIKWPNPWPRVFGYHEIFHAFTVVAAGAMLYVVSVCLSNHTLRSEYVAAAAAESLAQAALAVTVAGGF